MTGMSKASWLLLLLLLLLMMFLLLLMMFLFSKMLLLLLMMVMVVMVLGGSGLHLRSPSLLRGQIIPTARRAGRPKDVFLTLLAHGKKVDQRQTKVASKGNTFFFWWEEHFSTTCWICKLYTYEVNCFVMLRCKTLEIPPFGYFGILSMPIAILGTDTSTNDQSTVFCDCWLISLCLLARKQHVTHCCWLINTYGSKHILSMPLCSISKAMLFVE